MMKGRMRCTTARPLCNNNRARFSLHGISGRLRLSTTNTIVLISFPHGNLLTELVTCLGGLPQASLRAHVGMACRADSTAPYPEGAFNHQR
jgi:hypothetical protein